MVLALAFTLGPGLLHQDKILASIADDISRHSKGADKIKVRKCWDSIPTQLAKENKKFQYSKVESKGTTRKFGNSIQWLADADLVHRCPNVSTPTFPLRAYEREDHFKLYVGDTGLLVAMFGYEMKRAVLDRTLKGPAKGGLYENLIAEFLVKAGHSLHYYKPDENDQEIEFLLDHNRQPIPIEVKARRGQPDRSTGSSASTARRLRTSSPTGTSEAMESR